jgi:hypothetical protein
MSEPSLGRAMTPDELEYLSKTFLDKSAFDYKNDPVFYRTYFKAKYPGFTDDVIDIFALFEKGIRFKEFKKLLNKGRIQRQKALVEIQRFKEGVSPFDGSQCKMGT